MRSTIAPVDEPDTEFLVHPPRSLFPNVQDEISANIPPPTENNNWINGSNNMINGTNNLVFIKVI